MNAWDWYLDAWRNFGNFEGRSSRPAFWYFCLVNLIVVFMCLFLDVAIFGEADSPVLSTLYALATFIPGLSLSVRRLHDVGNSGWLLLVGVIPFIGQLGLLILLVEASESGPNQYGADPESTDTDPMDEYADDAIDELPSGPDDGANEAMNELPSDPDDGADDTMNELPSDPGSGADERYVPINKDLAALEEAALHRFAYWPTGGVPRVAAGVYTIWRGAEFVYVGMAGQGNAAKKEQAKLKGKPWGLQARLNSHASGSRSDDQFCMYICDRFIIPTLSSAESHQVETEELSLDVPTRQFIRKELSFRFIETPDGEPAYNIARMAQQGTLRAGKPLLNPLAVTVEKWAEELAKLKAYKEENGNCDVSDEPRLSRLRSWVHLVRAERADERLKSTEYPILCWQLDKLGFIWDLKAFHAEGHWNQMLEELLAYKKEHGDCLVPRFWPENQQLSNWVDTQRLVLRGLGKDKRQKLDDIGFVWDPDAFRWNQMLEELLAYKKEHGDCLVPRKWPENQQLSNWVDTQRRVPRLTESQRQKLDDIGFVWKLPRRRLWSRK